jgi:hypothetical protein
MSTALRISTSAVAIAVLLGTSALAQAREYRHVRHHRAVVGHSHYYGGGSYEYGGSPYYGGPGYNGSAISKLGYDGRDSNGAPRGGSDVSQFGGGRGR